MLLKLANSKKILFFGGKGGVGKTTVSAATAAACADSGAKVLLVSTDPAHNLGHLFDRTIGGTPTRISAGLDALELDPQETVNVHLKEISSSLLRGRQAYCACERCTRYARGSYFGADGRRG